MKSTHQVKSPRIGWIWSACQSEGCDPFRLLKFTWDTQTETSPPTRPFLIEQRSQELCSDGDGSLSADGNVVGTYIHGLFHNDALRRAILHELTERKGKTLAAKPG